MKTTIWILDCSFRFFSLHTYLLIVCGEFNHNSLLAGLTKKTKIDILGLIKEINNDEREREKERERERESS